MDLEEKLFKYFGYNTFLKGQKAVISKIIDKQSAIAIFPTGSGKSLCYQLPAKILNGITLVVSPLLALMKDQVEFLLRNNISAAKLDSTLSTDEYNNILKKARTGEIKILMISVERFKNERFRSHLQRMTVSLLVIDEAHCISEWGHNFRPDYLKIPFYQKEFKINQVLLLTATATPKVVEDMCNKFLIAKQNVIITGFYRKNLFLQVSPTHEDRKNTILLKRIMKNPNLATIVYVTLHKTAEDISYYLNSHNINSSAYHAGLKNEEREKIQNSFMNDKTPVIVATIAFGMGIDKKNIRRVIHYNMPKSIEGYSQEIGRAGRDGKKALCEILINRENINILENFIYEDTPERNDIKNILIKIKQLEQKEYEFSFLSLSRKNNIRLLPLKTFFVYLEIKGILKPKYTYFKKYKFKFIKTPDEIADNFDGERNTFIQTLFQHSEIKKVWANLDINSFLNKYKCNRKRVISALDYFNEKKWIDLRSGSSTEIFDIINQNYNIEHLSQDIFNIFKQKEKTEIDRIHNVFNFFEKQTCLNMNLAKYFGENIADKCNHCSSCMTNTISSLNLNHKKNLPFNLNGNITTTKNTGDLGEQLALEYLTQKRMKHLESNYKCKIGEIDLIFRDKKTLVFGEVKLRQNPYFGEAALAVTPKKQKKIIKVAKYYIQSKDLHKCNVRFDVIGIDKTATGWQYTHYEHAFLAE